MNIQEIYEQALIDPNLLSTINIDELLENIESETTEYLEGKTLATISKTIRNLLETTDYFQNIDSIFDKLIGYRYVERVCEIRTCVYIRWINPVKKRLETGGTVISIKICDKCVQVICKTVTGRHVSFRFNECIVFQKLTTEEQLILMAYEHIENV